jgi:hypothetical protein
MDIAVAWSVLSLASPPVFMSFCEEGVSVGVAAGVSVGVAAGVFVGVAAGVFVGVAAGVAVGVAVPPLPPLSLQHAIPNASPDTSIMPKVKTNAVLAFFITHRLSIPINIIYKTLQLSRSYCPTLAEDIHFFALLIMFIKSILV